MPETKNRFTISDLLDNITEAERGGVEPWEDGYEEDVRRRIPKIEAAVKELKKYMEVE